MTKPVDLSGGIIINRPAGKRIVITVTEKPDEQPSYDLGGTEGFIAADDAMFLHELNNHLLAIVASNNVKLAMAHHNMLTHMAQSQQAQLRHAVN
jgi:hypothetical protein